MNFDDSMKAIGGIVVLVFAIAALVLVFVFGPLAIIWLNLWLLDNVIYRWTNLAPVPSWVVYLVSMLAIIGGRISVKHSKE